MIRKKVFCLWSGGIDSTYMIYKYLKEDYYVSCGYVKITNNVNKTETELKAIDNMLPFFRSFDNFMYEDIILETTINKSFILDFSQIPIWILSILTTSGYDKVGIAYVMNDDAISYLNELKNIYNSYRELSSNSELPELEFPLSKIKKEYILISIPDELKKYTVFCENPILNKNNKYEICYSCSACRRRFELEINGDIPLDEHICVDEFIKNYQEYKKETYNLKNNSKQIKKYF